MCIRDRADADKSAKAPAAATAGGSPAQPATAKGSKAHDVPAGGADAPGTQVDTAGETAPATSSTGRATAAGAPRTGSGLLSSRRRDALVKRTEGYTEERFLNHQRHALEVERATYLEQARNLRAEAESLVEEMEPGDIQFDDESGEGGTVTVDRERDLALSAQALVAVDEIDHATAKMATMTYGICENCGRLIPKPRLEALPLSLIHI